MIAPNSKSEPLETSFSFTIQTDGAIDQDQLADAVAKALEPLAEQAVNVSDLAIRTLPRRDLGEQAGGYETRLWEKATCKSVDDPREKITNPDDDVEKVLREAEALQEQVSRLAEAAQRLSQRRG